MTDGSEYVELHAASAFSFLAGASQPEALAERAAQLDMPAVALADRNGLYGVARFHTMAKKHGIKAHIGAEIAVQSIGNKLTPPAWLPHQYPTATRVASAIRKQIREELYLTASAGVAPNKFLAKIASDWRKPDGLFVIQPDEVATFLPPLPVGRLPGVGKVTEARLEKLGILTVGDLKGLELPALETAFGSHGLRLYQLTRGIDENPVVPDRPTQSVSAEDTFERDVPLSETEPMIRRLAEKTWAASRKESRIARTVVLKLKTSEFKILTRSHTSPRPPSTCDELTNIALSLRDRIGLGPRQRFRLVGVGLSNFHNTEDTPSQPVLFE